MVVQQPIPVDGSGSTPTPPLQVREISLKQARPFIVKWHYSQLVPTGKNIFFGGFIGDDLYCVADYGIGVNGYQAPFLNRVIGKEVVGKATLVELKRLCRKEPKVSSSPLTKFLSICHIMLRRKGYKGVVSFSDPEQGHNGGIYKAANFKHLGGTNAEWHVIGTDGVTRHRRFPFRYAQRKGCSMEEARVALGLVRVKTEPKDRWFLEL